jgi:hypothetical protein
LAALEEEVLRGFFEGKKDSQNEGVHIEEDFVIPKEKEDLIDLLEDDSDDIIKYFEDFHVDVSSYHDGSTPKENLCP